MAIKSKLLDQIAIVCRRKGYAASTAKTYRHYCEEYVLWLRAQNGGQWVSPEHCGRDELQAWLTSLATVRNVSPTSQNVAFQAVLFLSREILGQTIEDVNALRAKRPQRLPTVLSVGEVSQLLAALSGRNLLIAQMLYGSGLRISEVFALRIKDIDFDRGTLHIRQAKGAKDRMVMLDPSLYDLLRVQIKSTATLHQQDVASGLSTAILPHAFGTTSRTAGCDPQSVDRPGRLESTNESRPIHSGTHLRRTCWSRARRCRKSRNSWDMPTSAPLRFICTAQSHRRQCWGARSIGSQRCPSLPLCINADTLQQFRALSC